METQTMGCKQTNRTYQVYIYRVDMYTVIDKFNAKLHNFVMVVRSQLMIWKLILDIGSYAFKYQNAKIHIQCGNLRLIKNVNPKLVFFSILHISAI